MQEEETQRGPDHEPRVEISESAAALEGSFQVSTSSFELVVHGHRDVEHVLHTTLLLDYLGREQSHETRDLDTTRDGHRTVL